jgi:hypothetical protein
MNATLKKFGLTLVVGSVAALGTSAARASDSGCHCGCGHTAAPAAVSPAPVAAPATTAVSAPIRYRSAYQGSVSTSNDSMYRYSWQQARRHIRGW